MRRIVPLVVLALIAIAFIMVNSPRVSAYSLEGVKQAPPQQGSIDVGSLGSPRILAWDPNKAELLWYGKDAGKTVTVNTSDTPKAILTTCGTNPGGDRIVVYQGAEKLADAQPSILPLNSGDILPLGANIGLSCALPGRIQYSPDGNRIGVIKYDAKTFNNPYAIGTLRVLKIPEGTEQASLSDVASFDLQNDGAVAVQLFTNTKNQSKSADIVFWDGNKTRKIEENIGVLNQDEKADCEFISVKVLRVGDKVFTLWGEKCKKGGNTWRMHRSDFGGGNGVDVKTGQTGVKGAAAYINSAASNEMYLLPGNQQVLFTVPNGRASNIADLMRFSVGDGGVSTLLEGIVVDQYPPTGPSLFARNPKGEYFAFVTRSGDGAEAIYLYNGTKPEEAPTKVAGGALDDRILGVAWSNDKLFYSMVGDLQALFSYTLGGESNLVTRGTYMGLAVNPDGSFAASSERADVGTNEFRQNLVLINIGEESKVNLTEGAKGDKPIQVLAVR
jgi:hypothetical protein